PAAERDEWVVRRIPLIPVSRGSRRRISAPTTENRQEERTPDETNLQVRGPHAHPARGPGLHVLRVAACPQSTRPGPRPETGEPVDGGGRGLPLVHEPPCQGPVAEQAGTREI